MSAPSPFRVYLIPNAGPTKTLECPRTVRSLAGAKQYAKQWAGDVGEKGSILISEGTKDVACGIVKNSVVTHWI